MPVFKTLPVDFDTSTLVAPIYNHHKQRGINWLAKVTGPNAANKKLHFLDHLGPLYDVSSVRKNDVLEIAADYVNQYKRRHINREFWRVDGAVEKGLQVEVFPTLAKAMRAAREIEQGKPRSDQPTPVTAHQWHHLTRNIDADEDQPII